MIRRGVNPHAVISTKEAERGIYIDFEGFEEKPPTLLGILIDNHLEQVVLDPEMELVAAARGHRLCSLDAEARRLLKLSSDEQRLIIAYSQHERKQIVTYAQIDIGGHYRDARMIAKRWRITLHLDKPLAGNGLKDFLEFIDFSRRSHLGQRKSTKRIRAVRDGIRAKHSYHALTAVQKAQWTKLLEHNAIDCHGMRALSVLAARELEELTSGASAQRGRRGGSSAGLISPLSRTGGGT